MQNGMVWWVGGALLLALVACDDTTSEDREDIVYLDGCDNCADGVNPDAIDPDGGDAVADVIGPPVGCFPVSSEELCITMLPVSCGFMATCSQGVCECHDGFVLDGNGSCVAERIDSCVESDSIPPALWHVDIGADITGDLGVAKLFPYRGEAIGEQYYALLAVHAVSTDLDPNPEDHRIAIYYVGEGITTLDDYGPLVENPVARFDIFEQGFPVGGVDSLLLFDVEPMFEDGGTLAFFTIDNHSVDSGVGIELIGGVTEPLPGTWPRTRTNLSNELELITARQREMRALSIDAARRDDGMYEVYVALFDDQNPEEGVAVYELVLNHNFELQGWSIVTRVEAVAADWLDFRLEVERESLMANIGGVVHEMSGLRDDGPKVWRAISAPTTGNSLHQPMNIVPTDCLGDVLFSRSGTENNAATYLLDANGRPGGEVVGMGGNRLHVGRTAPNALTAFWTEFTPNNEQPRLRMATLDDRDWSLRGPVFDLGSPDYGGFRDRTDGLQVVYNDDGTVVAALDRVIYRGRPARIDGLDLLVRPGVACGE